jgi:hypothetical protein
MLTDELRCLGLPAVKKTSTTTTTNKTREFPDRARGRPRSVGLLVAKKTRTTTTTRTIKTRNFLIVLVLVVVVGLLAVRKIEHDGTTTTTNTIKSLKPKRRGMIGACRINSPGQSRRRFGVVWLTSLHLRRIQKCFRF